MRHNYYKSTCSRDRFRGEVQKAGTTMQPGRALTTGIIIGSGLWLFGTPIFSVLGISVTAFLLLGGWKFMKQLQTFPRDFR